MNLECWKCAHLVEDLPKPLGRREECPQCGADLHVCRQCQFYDPSAPDACRETIADLVRDKDRANFCGYFTLNPHAHVAREDAAATAAREQLNELFGDTSAHTLPSGEDDAAARARRELESLFGLDKPESS